ncbi:hypothetical protein GXN76_01900 [Kroppenstedtia pulmonis]|uniref:Metalloenzyme domain-containing protein n=2 Tax=Kroppenstedtia pulmonis TaxID=1380685 RepID=A0A7D3XZW5_9BACL|nr:hypothetical protein GXN76_01900 [Kroppenstedtia pulmonis]
MSVMLLFIDGVGLGDEASYNPWYTCPTPHLENMLSGMSLVKNAVGRHSSDVILLETDASMGVPGLPQSATGQATIFTGRNAPKAMGEHQRGLPFRRLRNWVEQDNIYLQFQENDLRATFSNAYTKKFYDLPTTRKGWISVSTAAIQSTGQPLRMLEELLAGQAVFHDLTRKTLIHSHAAVEEISPEMAASHLLRLAEGYDLVIHEFFLSDFAGHKQDQDLIGWVTHHYDRFIGELVRSKGKQDGIVLVSDHGNSEDFRIKTHTYNSVPTLLVGDIFSEWKSRKGWDLTQIAPLLLHSAQKYANQDMK